MSKKILIVNNDLIGSHMAGPGIRYLNLARELHKHISVSFAVPEMSGGPDLGFSARVVTYRRKDWSTLAEEIYLHDAVLMPCDVIMEFAEPLAAKPAPCLIVDGYNPFMAEWLATWSLLPDQERWRLWTQHTLQLHRCAALGDFFICASDRQRDWWLGVLEANARIEPTVYATDTSLRKLVDLVPVGVSATPTNVERLEAHKRILMQWPAIGTKDPLIVWGGGLWPWLKPELAVEAIAILAQKGLPVRLLFPGTKRPGAQRSQSDAVVEKVTQKARDLNLLDRHVFLGNWVPYEEWLPLLSACNIALTLHADTYETRLAYRTRTIDFISAGVPIVTSPGDILSELVAQHQLGVVLEENTASNIAERIQEVLSAPMDRFTKNFARVINAKSWDKCVTPLLRFIEEELNRPLVTRKASVEPTLREQLRKLNDLHEENLRLHEENLRLHEENARLKVHLHNFQSGRLMQMIRLLGGGTKIEI